MGIKENFENHYVVFGLTALAVGFGAGIGAPKLLSDASTSSASAALTTETWQAAARTAGWTPKEECAAYPVSMSVTSPGNGSVLALSDGYIREPIVIQANRPIPDNNAVGIVVHQEGTPNFYVLFEYFDANPNRTVFTDTYVKLPFTPEAKATLTLWSVLVDDKKRFGSVYTSIDQIKNSSAEVILSPGISVVAAGKPDGQP